MDREEQFKNIKRETAITLFEAIEKGRMDVLEALEMAFKKGAETIATQALSITG